MQFLEFWGLSTRHSHSHARSSGVSQDVRDSKSVLQVILSTVLPTSGPTEPLLHRQTTFVQPLTTTKALSLLIAGSGAPVAAAGESEPAATAVRDQSAMHGFHAEPSSTLGSWLLNSIGQRVSL